MEFNIKRGLRSSPVWPLLSVGSNAIDLLIQRLNAGTDREAEALRELVRDFNQIDDIARTRGFPKVNVFERLPPHRKTYLGFDESSMKRFKKIRAAFKSYRLVPIPAYPQADGWKFHWLHPWGTAPKNARVMQWIYLAVIHDLAAIGKLRRVHECRFCRQWFFGSKIDQGVCSARCREKYWRTSPEGRTKRAAYMRGYRQRVERRRRNALKAAKKVLREGRHTSK
jgi:hypothetical protein